MQEADTVKFTKPLQQRRYGYVESTQNQRTPKQTATNTVQAIRK
jgi:hypothetical protein